MKCGLEISICISERVTFIRHCTWTVTLHILHIKGEQKPHIHISLYESNTLQE